MLLFFSDSALLILDPAWKDAAEQVKFDISSILRNITYILKVKKSNKNAIKTCNLLLSLMKNPWSHNVLPKIFHGNASHNEGNVLLLGTLNINMTQIINC